jgi:VWFA-related protein
MHTRTVIAFLLICISAVAAQEMPMFPARFDVVVVPVTVTDPSGRFVDGLRADQFEITEGATRRDIVQFRSGRVPVSLGILLDISGSMTGRPSARADTDARWADTRRVLELLVTRLDPDDEVSLAVFNDKVTLAPWTQDAVGLLRQFDGLRPGGGSVLLDAVPSALATFELARHQRKVLLLITDGNDVPARRDEAPYYNSDNGPPGHDALTIIGESPEMLRQRRISKTKSTVRRSDVTVYVLGMGTRKGSFVDKVLLESLTTGSGGYVELLRDPAEIFAAVTRIYDDLQSQYLLAIESPPADGKYHGITVTTKNPQLRVRAREGYTALPASTQ